MQRLRSIFSSQERRQQSFAANSSQDEDFIAASASSTAPTNNEDSWTSIESEIFATDSASSTWLDDGKWTTSVEFASDPTAWELQLEKSWSKLEELMQKTKNDKDALAKVHEHLSSICKLLVMEVNSQSEPSIGPILEHFFNEEILLLVQKWALKVPHVQIQRCQIVLVRIYENMVNCCQCPQSLLVHKPILIPLLQLLQWCRKTTDERLGIQKVPKYLATAVDRCFVRLINQICRKIAEDETLLHFFFHSSVSTPRSGSEDESETENGEEESEEAKQHKPFLIFDLLVPYVYAPEDVGQLARDALLLIMSASRRHQFVADYVIQRSDFCHVLAGGLSACFSQLPTCVFTKLGLDQEEAHKLNVSDVKAMPQLYEFHNALLFANSVAQVAHGDIVRQIANFIYTGFLQKVFKTSIIEQIPKKFVASSQSEPKEEELCSRLVYFHLCVDTISTPALLKMFIKVLLVSDEMEEGDKLEEDLNILELLLLKMQDSERLCRITLSLIRTLLDLRCEDLLWCTVFRHLLPFIPLKTKTQSRRFHASVSINAANFFLKCIPECARGILELCSEEQFDAYLREAGESVREFEQSCTCWMLKYDGNMPTTILQNLSSNSDEMLSARQPFTRFSSARSSFASTGWNRYGTSRSGHGTLLDGTLDAITQLNELGQDEEELIREEDLLNRFDAGTNSSQEDFSDTNVELPNDTRLDYFQFAYEGVSESDPDSCSRRNSEEESQEECTRSGRKQLQQMHTTTATTLGSQSAQSSARGSVASSAKPQKAPESQLMDAIMQTDWAEANMSRDKFIALLNALPIKAAPAQMESPKRQKTMDENVALIDARWQYLEELRKEKADTARRTEAEHNPFRLDLSDEQQQPKPSKPENVGGFPMIATDEKGAGVLLESLFDVLSRLPEYNFATNMQLVGVFNVLLSYPQPLLTTYLLYVDSLRSKALFRITDILNKVKTQIDGYATTNGSPEEFEQLLRRGLRHRLSRAELHERRTQKAGNFVENGGPGSSRSARGTGGFFMATAATVGTAERQAKAGKEEEQPRPSARRNNFAYAAIVLSQLCQMMAAFALQHSPAMIQQQNGLSRGR